LKVLAAFAMRGRLQAVMISVAFAALAMIVAPLAVFSSAFVGLATLRHGVREGLLVTLLGSVVLALIGELSLQQGASFALMGLGLWLPLLLLGWVLRTWRSLVIASYAALLLAVALVLLQYLAWGDPTAFWSELLRGLLQQMTPESSTLDPTQVDQVIGSIAPWMVGIAAGAWLVQLILSLYLARSWQAQLYNPGGFRSEFLTLNFGRGLAIAVPVLLVFGFLGEEKPGLASHLLAVGMTGFFIQGVALVHALVAKLGGGFVWLIGFYALLFIGMPPSFILVSAAGFADSWLNLRDKVPARSGN
jgi:hypothetical protein